MNPPLISVIIPSSNRPQSLLRALAGLERQEGVGEPFEVVLVLDGDRAGSAELVAGAATELPITIIQIPHSGVAGARNRGWRAARASIILFLDDDVVPGPGLLAAHLAAHSRHPDAVVLGHVDCPTGPAPAPWVAYDNSMRAKKYAELAAEVSPQGIHYGGNFSIPKRWLLAAGDERPQVADADVSLGYRLRALGVRFVYEPRARGIHESQAHLSSWRQRQVSRGRLSVARHSNGSYPGGLPGLLASFWTRHPANRAMVRVGLLGGRLERRLTSLLIAIGCATARLGPVSLAAFSMAANLIYWSGVRDGMRGNAAFWRGVRAARPAEVRAIDGGRLLH